MSDLYRKFHNSSTWPPVIKPSKERPDSFSGAGIALDWEQISIPLSNVLESRETAKKITPKRHFNMADLGTFLKWSAGDLHNGRRSYPSAGSLYPVSIYIAIQNMEGIDSGVYVYNPKNHTLHLINQQAEIQTGLVQENINPNLYCIVAANLKLSFDHYGERGYRFCLLEAGHIVQNMMLVAAAINMSIAPVGGFKDDVVNNLFNGVKEDIKAIYLVPVGEKRR